MGAIGGCAWNSWLRDLAPEDRMGRIFARRTFYATVTTLVAGIAAAHALEATPEDGGARDWRSAALYGAGSIAGLTSAWNGSRPTHTRLPAPPPHPTTHHHPLRSPLP